MGSRGSGFWRSAGAVFLVGCGLGDSQLNHYQLNLQTPHTLLGEKIYDLHTIITVICFIIFVGVFGFMFYAVFKHRKSVGHKAAQFHENTAVEVASGR
jgi:cytochrome c oxidase subunit II